MTKPNVAHPNSKPIKHLKPRRDWGLRWYLYLTPMLIMLVFVFGYPIVSVVRYSFYAGNMNNMKPVGFANYRGLFDDPIFWKSITNNMIMLLTVPIMVFLALLLAIIMYEGVKGWKFYRFIVFMPYVISATVVGITFSYLYQYNGVLNTSLRSLNLNPFAWDWLGDANLVVPSIMSVIIWQQVGFGVILFLAHMLSLPKEVFEAAELDGVKWWQKQWYIMIPQMRGVVEFFAITEAINMLSWVFNYVYVLSMGGPGNSSYVLEIYIWKNAFFYHSYGLASAASTILLGITMILIFLYFQIRKQNAAREGE